MADTIQRQVFNEIKRRDKISLSDIAKELNVDKSSISMRMNGGMRLDNFWEMLQICGYSINIYKTPEGEENKIGVGEIDCQNCAYKTLAHEMDSKFRYLIEQTEKNKAVPLN